MSRKPTITSAAATGPLPELVRVSRRPAKTALLAVGILPVALGFEIDGFADALEQDGYSHGSVVRYLRDAAHLGQFQQRHHKTLGVAIRLCRISEQAPRRKTTLTSARRRESSGLVNINQVRGLFPRFIDGIHCISHALHQIR